MGKHSSSIGSRLEIKGRRARGVHRWHAEDIVAQNRITLSKTALATVWVESGLGLMIVWEIGAGHGENYVKRASGAKRRRRRKKVGRLGSKWVHWRNDGLLEGIVAIFVCN